MENEIREIEVEEMNRGETLGLLEALKIITEQAADKDEIIRAINRIQDKIKEPTPR